MKTMQPIERLVREMIYLNDAIDTAWDLGAYESVVVLADYLLMVRREYKLEMIKP